MEGPRKPRRWLLLPPLQDARGGLGHPAEAVGVAGIGGVTEDCFRERPLEFAGDKQWVIYTPDEATGHMTELEAARTTEGTSPPGSMWTANPFKRFGEGATLGTSGGEVVDYVKIPEEVEAGEYVLGFRWDCKCTPQVWTVCSNVLIL